MSDYSGQWIANIVPSDPQGTEKKSLGDDAIRQTRYALKNAFPNSLVGDKYEGQLSELSDLVANSVIPRDCIMPYVGGVVDGPPGWTICDGRPRKSGGGNAPNLSGRFLRGHSPAFGINVGDTGGSSNTVISGQITNGHNLAPSEIPSLSNNILITMANNSSSDSHNDGNAVARGSNPSTSQRSQPMATTGLNGAAHTHPFSVNGTNTNNPSYYATIFIIKD